MISSTLLEGRSRMEFYTDLRLVWQALRGRHIEFNWLLTDLDWIVLGPDVDPAFIPESREPQWWVGSDLGDFVQRFRIQWVWAVLSGFPNGVEVDLSSLEVYPFADGNPRLWQPDPAIQHPAAEVEIVCWDSTSTLLLSRDEDLTTSFRDFFPEAVDLSEFNRRSTKARS